MTVSLRGWLWLWLAWSVVFVTSAAGLGVVLVLSRGRDLFGMLVLWAVLWASSAAMSFCSRRVLEVGRREVGT